MSEKISSFKDLQVHKLAFEVRLEIFETPQTVSGGRPPCSG